MPIRIQLQDQLFPVQTFFNAIGDHEFWDIIHGLKNRVSYGLDVCFCEFPESLDFDEEPFEGVRFRIYEDEVIITEAEFEKLLQKLATIQVCRFPDQVDLYQAYFVPEKT
ncbi:MAG: ribonuclease toxin immunity protein CdiI [bacterium]|uniref:Uncharacterized protein n=1 Tax=Gimesia chilikensis TaxID=2605989 RepID=A0A517PFZ1_9PLAN|nr:ribonuclease toxin immunity protein CdiI [Gimesia chilikensis]MCR9233095.1 ribonuclease toxin immunity protein CdiI [bacterium]QDT18293.1 hypothetical protein HG66A1_00520 [Gimesia chilikensis]